MRKTVIRKTIFACVSLLLIFTTSCTRQSSDPLALLVNDLTILEVDDRVEFSISTDMMIEVSWSPSHQFRFISIARPELILEAEASGDATVYLKFWYTNARPGEPPKCIPLI